MLKGQDSAVIDTGNILNVNKKAGQKPDEELLDCLTITIAEHAISKTGTFVRQSDDLSEKLAEHKREDIKVGAKVFLNKFSTDALTAAIQYLLVTLNVTHLDNLILAYHPAGATLTNGGTHAAQNGTTNGTSGSPTTNGVLEYSVRALPELQKLWTVLEQFANDQKICQLGIADLDTESLQKLFAGSTVRPSIAQINLSACCVVPPSLQEFCTQNDVQLLTHSDPEVILSGDTLRSLDMAEYTNAWTTRYQVHVRCRGVLAAKGFIVGLKHD